MFNRDILKNISSVEEAINIIRKELETYIKEKNLKSLVIGVSGGIDSALCLALAQPVCKKLNIPLIGFYLDIREQDRSKYQDEIDRANNLGKHFCDIYENVNLFEQYSCFKNKLYPLLSSVAVSTELEDKIQMGNIKARVRMIYLYHQAHINKGIVLSTDNLTEYLLGFWTLHGDVGDYGMIQQLWKTEVYGMANFLLKDDLNNALQDAIFAIPTDGLEITNSDLDQLGAKDYSEVDEILIKYLKLKNGVEVTWTWGIADEVQKMEEHPVIKRHLNSEFKRKNPLNINRGKLLGEPF